MFVCMYKVSIIIVLLVYYALFFVVVICGIYYIRFVYSILNNNITNINSLSLTIFYEPSLGR